MLNVIHGVAKNVSLDLGYVPAHNCTQRNIIILK